MWQSPTKWRRGISFNSTNIAQWSDGLGIDPEQVGIYLSLREAAAARLFANNKWLSKYIQDVITAYGKGITIDVESITRQAEEAMASGEIDINNPNAINIAFKLWIIHTSTNTSSRASIN